MSSVAAERLADVFVEVADTLVDEFDLIEFLQMVTSRSAELVHADAAGLLLADHENQLQFVAGTDEATRLLELYQLQAEEGPCLDCFHTGAPVVNAELADAADRWPEFASQAVGAGFNSVHAIPLRLRSEVIGALNLFGKGSGAGQLRPEDVHVVQALADIATIGLLQERTIRRAEVLTEQLQHALNSRIVIEQAKGVVAQTRGVSVDEAFELLREYSRRQQQRLSVVAHAIASEPASIPDLAAP